MPVELPVAPIPAQDPKKKKEKSGDEESKPAAAGKDAPGAKPTDEEELSEEDQALKNELEMLVERLQESDTRLYRPALEALRTLIRTSTSSMTSVPKPLKFLRPVYPSLQTLYESWPPSLDKALFAEILSVLAMTYSDTQPRGTLKYRLLGDEIVANIGGSSKDGEKKSDPGSWGHEYVRHIAAELGTEYAARKESESGVDDLIALSVTCSAFLLQHNAEADAVDLLEEVESIGEIVNLVDQNTYTRVCTYMVSCVNFLAPPDDLTFLETAHKLYVKYSKFPEALALAIRLYNPELIRQDFKAPANPSMKRQLAFIIARAGIPLEWVLDQDEDAEPLEEDLMECLCNSKLSTHFRAFGKDVGALEPKSLEDIYKSHLEQTRLPTTGGGDSARANLAGTFVNAFVNAGFGNDKLMAKADAGDSWVYKNKDHGVTSAAASLGMCVLWDTNDGLGEVDKYTYLNDEKIKGGALMATGMLQCNVRDENEAIVALLEDFVTDKSALLRRSAIVGLGMAYVGTHKDRILELLLPVVSDETVSMELCSLAALSVGFTFVGSCNGDIAATIVQALMERAESDSNQLDDKFTRFMLLGLGLLFVGGQDKSDVIIETLKIIQHPCSKQAQVIVEMCSFAGTSNVLNVQSMLHYCTEVVDKETGGDDIYQAYAVMGIALTAMGEDVGAEMALRTFSNLMHYGEPTVRRSVPLALALLSASNPQVGLIDTLSKYSHDSDIGVAMNAILAMGFIGAGTNNARLAQMLRQLAVYYHREPDALFIVRVSQGLLHMGKGTIGINPFFDDRNTMSKNAIAGLLATLLAFSDAKAFILSESHWMLFWLVMAMQPRFMMTLDEKLEMLPVTVRVGQAVDVVGQAGKPRTISGFQTHLSPVRLGYGDRAELGTEEYLSFASVLEGLVILTKNPGYEGEDSRMEL
ncbi:hypothetical protein M408DRAFT_86555 [Serendipita vermifera MAFF 305830]|uniref:26S proteasome regulatory subunit RPN1 n=1 Tax=Serendipita vermifera MAFF 305830 TaxID=933852 RepID=A0A0C3BQY4_SERVB|nr:hypothetical protein M408DRAFT_86555 [Serendipita vermifera MAFF 305830]